MHAPVCTLSLPRLPPSHSQELKQTTKEEAVKLVWDYLTANNCKVGGTLPAMREQGVQGSGTWGQDRGVRVKVLNFEAETDGDRQAVLGPHHIASASLNLRRR